MGKGRVAELVAVDTRKCIGCGFCTMVCPHRNFSLGKDGKVRLAGDSCIRCGHCEAACPARAIVVAGLQNQLRLRYVEEKDGVSSPGSDDAASLVRLMRSRRSCRKFRDIQVETGLLEDLVKIGVTAPSATNSQGWGFKIIPDRKGMLVLGKEIADYYRKLNKVAQRPLLRVLSRLFYGSVLQNYYEEYFPGIKKALDCWYEKGEDLLFHGAPCALLITGDQRASCPGEDVMLVTQNILLAAHAIGLGSCLIGFAVEAVKRDKKLKKLCGIGADEHLYSFIVFGYPAERYLRPAGRKKYQQTVLQLYHAENPCRGEEEKSDR